MAVPARQHIPLVLLTLGLLPLACSGNGGNDTDADSATPTDAGGDAGLDGAVDAGLDGALDASTDAAVDAGPHQMGPLTSGLATLVGHSESGTVNGPREFALFNNPVNVVVGPDDNLYVADFYNSRIRVVTPTGDTSTLVEQTGFQRPFAMVFAGDGTFYVQTDRSSEGASTGALWTVDTETGLATVEIDNSGRARGLAVLDDKRLVLADTLQHTLSIYDPDDQSLVPLAGAAGEAAFVDGTGSNARFNRPVDVVLNGDGDLLVADSFNHRIRKVTLAGVVTTVAGNGTEASTDGLALSASLAIPSGLALDDAGNLFIGEFNSGRLRMLSTATLSTVAGSTPGFSDDADPLAGQLFANEGLDFRAPYLYISDGTGGLGGPYHRVRRLDLGSDN